MLIQVVVVGPFRAHIQAPGSIMKANIQALISIHGRWILGQDTDFREQLVASRLRVRNVKFDGLAKQRARHLAAHCRVVPESAQHLLCIFQGNDALQNSHSAMDVCCNEAAVVRSGTSGWGAIAGVRLEQLSE